MNNTILTGITIFVVVLAVVLVCVTFVIFILSENYEETEIKIEKPRDLYYPDLIGHPEIVQQVFESCKGSVIEPELILALIKVETNFQNIISRPNRDGSFDIGLCALNSYTYREYSVEDLLKPDVNIGLAIKHLEKDLIKYKGNIISTLLAYNTGYALIRNSQIGEVNLAYVNKIIVCRGWLIEKYLEHLQGV